MPAEVEGLVLSCAERADPWLAYKTARQALRYGQCGIAEKIFQKLAKKVRIFSTHNESKRVVKK